jgi:hypothetical protein
MNDLLETERSRRSCKLDTLSNTAFLHHRTSLLAGLIRCSRLNNGHAVTAKSWLCLFLVIQTGSIGISKKLRGSMKLGRHDEATEKDKHESKGQKDLVWSIDGAIQQTMAEMMALLPAADKSCRHLCRH